MSAGAQEMTVVIITSLKTRPVIAINLGTEKAKANDIEALALAIIECNT